MRPPQSEVDEQRVRCGEHAARRLAGDERGVVNDIQQTAFDELGFPQRRGDTQQRLVGEADRTFRDRVHVAGEAEVSQRLDECRRKALRPGKPCELVGSEDKRRQVIDCLLETGGDEEVPTRRQLAHEQFENRCAIHPLLPVGLQHRQLVKVGQKDAGRLHGLDPAMSSAGRRQQRSSQVSGCWQMTPWALGVFAFWMIKRRPAGR